jgi:hypothetical protein
MPFRAPFPSFSLTFFPGSGSKHSFDRPRFARRAGFAISLKQRLILDRLHPISAEPIRAWGRNTAPAEGHAVADPGVGAR